jgi:hypothetical protein
MNPPFSAVGGRMPGRKLIETRASHIEQHSVEIF